MCGIFGWSFKRKARISPGQREVLASTLAVANSYRGDQSWGCAFLDRAGKQRVRREIGDISDTPGIASLGAWDLVMAHTRYATTGKVIKDNQHPFRAGPILLAHNGVVFNHDDLNRKLGRSCEVDSQHFAHHLAEGRDFSDIEAYGAIEWIEDKSPRTVNVCRMRRGQLAVYGIRNAKGKQVGTVWSSDVEHLRSAIGAARLDAFPYKKLDEDHVFTIRDGRLFQDPRRLSCVEPEWDPQEWARQYRTYQSTQSGGRGCLTESDKGTTEISRTYSSQGVLRTRTFRTPSGTVYELPVRELPRPEDKPEEDKGAGPLTLFRGTTDPEDGDRVQVDAGLYFNQKTGKLEDEGGKLTEACDTCGALTGKDENGDCRECFTGSENYSHSRLMELTDEEWVRYQERFN